MRISPLALLPDYMKYYAQDTSITNANAINIECSLVYLTMLRGALLDHTKEQIVDAGRAQCKNPILIEVFDSVNCSNTKRNLVTNKGWVVHALWCVLYCLKCFDNYANAIHSVVRDFSGSDTDTNACIAGALLGAFYGFKSMCSDLTIKENVDIVLGCSATRPTEYMIKDFDQVTQQAFVIANTNNSTNFFRAYKK
jgi:ADP-ribosylglycohydrolase